MASKERNSINTNNVVNSSGGNEKPMKDALLMLNSDLISRFGEVRYDEPTFQAKMAEYLCQIFKKCQADASGIECFNSKGNLQTEIDFSNAYKTCAWDLGELRKRFPNLTNKHTLYQLIYGKLVCYILRIKSYVKLGANICIDQFPKIDFEVEAKNYWIRVCQIRDRHSHTSQGYFLEIDEFEKFLRNTQETKNVKDERLGKPLKRKLESKLVEPDRTLFTQMIRIHAAMLSFKRKFGKQPYEEIVFQMRLGASLTLCESDTMQCCPTLEHLAPAPQIKYHPIQQLETARIFLNNARGAHCKEKSNDANFHTQLSSFESEIVKLEKDYGELPYFNPFFHAEVARRMPDNLKEKIYDVLLNGVDVNIIAHEEKAYERAIFPIINDLKNRFGEVRFDEPGFQTKMGEYLCSLLKKQLADASGVGCFSINDHIRSQIDYSSAYKMCAEDLRGWKERVPGLPYSHIFFLAVYGQLVCYRLKIKSNLRNENTDISVKSFPRINFGEELKKYWLRVDRMKNEHGDLPNGHALIEHEFDKLLDNLEGPVVNKKIKLCAEDDLKYPASCSDFTQNEELDFGKGVKLLSQRLKDMKARFGELPYDRIIYEFLLGRFATTILNRKPGVLNANEYPITHYESTRRLSSEIRARIRAACLGKAKEDIDNNGNKILLHEGDLEQQLAFFENEIMKLEKRFGELPYFNPLFHVEVARKMPENLQANIYDMLSRLDD